MIECCVGKTNILNISVMSILTSCLVVEFIHLLSSEANEICEKESKKTIAPEHIISALQVLLSLEIVYLSPDQRFQSLGFQSFIPEVQDVLKDHRQLQKVPKINHRRDGVR